MSGPIEDIPVHVCRVPGCRTIWLADPNMWEDVRRCPKCGAYEPPPPSDSPDMFGTSSPRGLSFALDLELSVTIPYRSIDPSGAGEPEVIMTQVLGGTAASCAHRIS